MEEACRIYMRLRLHLSNQLRYRWTFSCFPYAQSRIQQDTHGDFTPPFVADPGIRRFQLFLGSCCELLWQKTSLCICVSPAVRSIYLGSLCPKLQ
jgi:hypothetical protein